MGDYRRKLRSGKNLGEEQVEKSNEGPESPKTPPMRNIEYYFPPSPYHKKKTESYIDRLMTQKEHTTFQLNIPTNVKEIEQPNPNSMPVKKIAEFFVEEVLPPSVPIKPKHTPRRSSYIPESRFTKTPMHLSRKSELITNYYRPLNSTCSSLLHRHSIHDTSLHDPNSPRYQTQHVTDVGQRILFSATNRMHPIKSVPMKTLEAPGLKGDFYYHLIDWGPHHLLAVGLATCVYLWDSSTSNVTQLCDLQEDEVTSVKWSTVGTLLTITTETGKTILYDTTTQQRLRTWFTHYDPKEGCIVTTTWKSNILTTGGRRSIYHHDVRSATDHFRKLTGHTQQVIGLQWNPEGTLLASGSGDCHVLTWDMHENSIYRKLKGHTAAVRAVAWSPHKRGVLVSGGGTEDRTIKFWDTLHGQLTSSHDTGSQVCNLEWSKRSDHIISSHGFATDASIKPNQLNVWQPNTMAKIASLDAHDSRVLYMTLSHDGSTVVTGAGNNELRFWDLFSSIPVLRNEPEDKNTRIR